MPAKICCSNDLVATPVGPCSKYDTLTSKMKQGQRGKDSLILKEFGLTDMLHMVDGKYEGGRGV